MRFPTLVIVCLALVGCGGAGDQADDRADAKAQALSASAEQVHVLRSDDPEALAALARVQDLIFAGGLGLPPPPPTSSN